MCDDKTKEASKEVNAKILDFNEKKNQKHFEGEMKSFLEEMMPNVDFGDIHATGIGITRIEIQEDGTVKQEQVSPEKFFKDMEEMKREAEEASLYEKLVTWWWNVKRNLFYKHDYVLAGYKESFIPPMRFPVYQCTKCKKTLMLEPWQMESLPRSQKYGCIARGKGNAEGQNETHS